MDKPHGAPRLLQELKRLSKELPFNRKILICHTPAHGRELLHAVASAGTHWIGWEATSLLKIAAELASNGMLLAGESEADEFDTLALLDQAIDGVSERNAARSFGAAVGTLGYRDAVRRVVAQLREAALAPDDLRRVKQGDTAKLAVIADIFREYESLLPGARLLDGPGLLLRAVEVLRATSEALEEGRYFLVPGLSLRGAQGALVRELLTTGRVELLGSDAVVGLRVPGGIAVELEPESVGPLSRLHDPSSATDAPNIQLFAAATPTDELREVLRRVMALGVAWDQVEIIATDPNTYGAAMDSLARRLGVPVTYSMGLDVRRTTVGRAVEAYFRWITDGFPADLVREMLESGALAPADADADVTASALARRLRRLRIGWGQERYLETIRQALQETARPIEYGEDGEPLAQDENLEREKVELSALEALLGPILAATPRLPDRAHSGIVRTSPAALARGVLAFLERVPTSDAMEGTTRKMLRDRLERAASVLTRESGWEAAVAVLRRLLQTRVAPANDGALATWTSSPGRLHFSDVGAGGFACRPHTFVVGLDASRTAGPVGTDPLLTETDRRLLNAVVDHPAAPLPGLGERLEEHRYLLASMLARLRGEITLSYSAWDSADGRLVSPAPELLQAHRLRVGDPNLGYADLRASLGTLKCAVPVTGKCADESDVWLAALSDGRVLRLGETLVRSLFPGVDGGLHAARERTRELVTEFHGRVGPHPELDPLSDHDAVFSASRLETLGKCPRQYFYKYVLGVKPPEDPEWNPEQWLDPLQRGTLLHSVYERSLREARAADLSYQDDGFAGLTEEIIADEIRRMVAVVPPPSEAVHLAEAATLREDVRVFVNRVRREQPDWIDLELRFGPEHRDVLIPIGSRMLRVSGAIDRIDRVSPTGVRIVDYKTGRASSHKPSQPYMGGRRIQHVLYTLAAEQLLDGSVESVEYHFPTRKGEDRVVAYTGGHLENGVEVLETLVGIAANGHFVTTDDTYDCRYCHYVAVCRAVTGDYATTCSIVEWSEAAIESEPPEYARLARLRGLDG